MVLSTHYIDILASAEIQALAFDAYRMLGNVQDYWCFSII